MPPIAGSNVTKLAFSSQALDDWFGSPVEKRAHLRHGISLSGVCSVAGGPDVACSSMDMSLAGLALSAKARVLVGQPAAVALPQVGLLRGRVVRQWHDGFALTFEDSKVQRKRIGNFLTWLTARKDDPSFEDRSFERIVPLRRMVTLTTAIGVSCMARILDVSRSGVAVTTTATIAVGDVVRVGSTAAMVTRLIDGGFAAQFAPQLAGPVDASIRL